MLSTNAPYSTGYGMPLAKLAYLLVVEKFLNALFNAFCWKIGRVAEGGRLPLERNKDNDNQ